MAHNDNVHMLAKKLGIPTTPELMEKGLRIAKIRFLDKKGKPVKDDVVASDKNRGSRLFLQDQAMAFPGAPRPEIPCDNTLRNLAAEYFAEWWDDEVGTGKHPVIDGIRSAAHTIEIVWKNPTLG